MTSYDAERPTFTPTEAQQLAREYYDFVSTGAVELPGEIDQNFRLLPPDGAPRILKIAHTGEDRAVLDLQNRALQHLAAAGLSDGSSVPQVCPNRAGDDITPITAADGSPHDMRLLTYVPGVPLIDIKPHRPALLRAVGSFLGTLDRGLATFSHPQRRGDLRWHLANAGQVIREHLPRVRDDEQRDLIEPVLARFESLVAPALPDLRHSFIHNDANDHNILIDRSDPANPTVGGLIDFGDMVYGPTVCELAIALAYILMNKADPLNTALPVIAGYHAAYPLTERELELLDTLIRARLCVTVCVSALEDGNAHLNQHATPAVNLLDQLAQLPPNLLHYAYRHACDLEPCPTTPHIIDWIARQPPASIIDANLRREPCLVFDLSYSSTQFGHVLDVRDTAKFSRRIDALLADAGVRIGIGRYDEARPIYVGDMFAADYSEIDERRTIHIGLDIFMAAGSPIYAPFDGVVHSFRNNTARLDYGPTIILEHNADGVPFYTLYGHLSEESLDGLHVGKAFQRGDQLATIGAPPINGDWPPHVHFQIITDILGREGEFPGVALPSQRAIWRSIAPDPNRSLRIPADRFPAPSLTTDEILSLRHKHIGGALSIAYRDRPLNIVRGRLQYLYDANGHAYLDMVNNVAHVGHEHARVVDAARRQIEVLNTNTRYLHELLVRYAERLAATLPDPLRVCYFVNSGSEANELALRLAWAHTGRRDVLVIDHAYHGHTATMIDISPYKFDGPGGRGKPDWVHKVELPDLYRGAFRYGDPYAGANYAADVARVIAGMTANGRQPAVFFAESILGCGGQLVLPAGYLEAAYVHVRAAGGVCVADEVQVGFGRAGSHFWAFETQRVVPDIVVMGKPIGNGHPLAAVVTTPEIAASFDNGMEYFNTFGGNPVSCAVGLAVLDVMEREGLQAHALETGAYLLDAARQLADRHAIIGDVRGLGLFDGIELVTDRAERTPAPRQTDYIIGRMRELGILLSSEGPGHNVLKIKPPLAITRANIDLFITALDRVLGEDAAQVS